jgi:hypothetical protein
VSKRKLAMQGIGFVFLFAAGCQNERKGEQAQPAVNGAQNTPTDKKEGASALPDRWLGKWLGPEGTSLDLTKNGDRFVIKIVSLDGPATYEGISVSDHIEFQRNGERESIHAGNGKDTGMKWLLDEKNCLVIKKSEGFCR